jgi:DNA-binding CsgD family transcriptional regulator
LRSGLAYDNFQFEKTRANTASAKSRLAFSDVHNMGVLTVKTFRAQRFIPPFANNIHQLRLVLCQRGWQFLGRNARGRVPEELIKRWSDLDKLVTEKFASGVSGVSDQFHAAHVKAVRRAGSWMSLQAAVCYRSWRLGMDSCTIAESLGISPQVVRVTLRRTMMTARKLGLDCSQPHWTNKGRRLAPLAHEMDLALVAESFRAGISISEIARRMKVNEGRLRQTIRCVGPLFGLQTKPKLDPVRCQKLRARGLSFRKIGLMHGKTGSAVWRVCKQSRVCPENGLAAD